MNTGESKPEETRKDSGVPLRVLVVEDSEFDAQIMTAMLRRGGYDVQYVRVETAPAMRTALSEGRWDIVLADYHLPEFSAPEALEVLKESGLDIPFIIISGGIGESTAVAAMKAGAHDYLMKGNLARLAPVVNRELREASNRAGRQEAKEALRLSEQRYRLLWETALDAILLIDTGNRIRFANPAVQDVFGYTPEELTGQDLAILEPPSLQLSYQEAMKRWIKAGRKRSPLHAFESFGLRKDGSEIPVEVAFSEMDTEGKRWLVAFFRDVSERKRVERELQENEEQFRVARDIQQLLFPKRAPKIPGLEIAGASRPAEATGGDYFDYLTMTGGCLGLVVGDVTGHGVGPALLMAEARAYLRLLVREHENVGQIITQANQVLAEDLGSERFVTMIFASIDPVRRTLRYVNAGHPPGYLLDGEGGIKAELRRTGVPLGIRFDTAYETSAEVPISVGDILVLLTDGFEETLGQENLFSGADQVLRLVRQYRAESADRIVEALYQAVDACSAGEPQEDDLTVIVAKVTA